MSEASLATQNEKKEGQLKEVQKRIEDATKADKEVRESLSGFIATREEKVKTLEQEGEGVKGLREEISARESSVKSLREELKTIQEAIAQQGITLENLGE